MAPVPARNRSSIILKIINSKRKRRKEQQHILFLLRQHQRMLKVMIIAGLILLARQQINTADRFRSCRRLLRNHGWWDNVWSSYSNKRLKNCFRVSRQTFLYLLEHLRNDLEKVSLTEDPIPPECRLAICLFRLGRGDYYHTISELTGLGTATVCNITLEVSKAIVKELWDKTVVKHFPKTQQDFEDKMALMDEEWQFPYAFGAVDGCHLPIKCPPGGSEAAKEYHNFKSFYSMVLMAIVDPKKRFIWGSVGFPGNSHDSTIFKSTKIYSEIVEDGIIPSIAQKESNTNVYPMILGDGAFPFRPWLMKPFSNAKLSQSERYFNYRLSRARMVVEGAFGLLKGRWRILYRKCESKKDSVKWFALACIVLHNICFDHNDVAQRNWDLSNDCQTNGRRPHQLVRDILQMSQCRNIPDNSHQAGKIRNALKTKFWHERMGRSPVQH